MVIVYEIDFREVSPTQFPDILGEVHVQAMAELSDIFDVPIPESTPNYTISDFSWMDADSNTIGLNPFHLAGDKGLEIFLHEETHWFHHASSDQYMKNYQTDGGRNVNEMVAQLGALLVMQKGIYQEEWKKSEASVRLTGYGELLLYHVNNDDTHLESKVFTEEEGIRMDLTHTDGYAAASFLAQTEISDSTLHKLVHANLRTTRKTLIKADYDGEFNGKLHLHERLIESFMDLLGKQGEFMQYSGESPM